MAKIHLTLLILLLTSLLFAQDKKVAASTLADCEGAMNIFKSGKYSINDILEKPRK